MYLKSFQRICLILKLIIKKNWLLCNKFFCKNIFTVTLFCNNFAVEQFLVVLNVCSATSNHASEAFNWAVIASADFNVTLLSSKIFFLICLLIWSRFWVQKVSIISHSWASLKKLDKKFKIKFFYFNILCSIIKHAFTISDGRSSLSAKDPSILIWVIMLAPSSTASTVKLINSKKVLLFIFSE